MGPADPGTADRPPDVNAVIGGVLRDLAFVQPSPGQMLGYKRAASAILALDQPVTALVEAASGLPKIAGIGPGSARVILEILETGASVTVERAIEASGKRADIERRRSLRQHFLSRAEVVRVLGDPRLTGPRQIDYRGDLQMHSEWSDGSATVEEMAAACRARGYSYSAVTDHSHGLTIAGGMSMAEAGAQRVAIDRVNETARDGFRLLQGVEANIGVAGQLDLSAAEAATFDLVLAAPHSRLRRPEDQTARMVAAVERPTCGSWRTRGGAWPAPGAASWPTGTWSSPPPPRAASLSRSTGTRRGRISTTPWRGGRCRRAASSPSTATRTRRRSCPMPTPPSRTHGWPASHPSGSSTAGRSIACCRGLLQLIHLGPDRRGPGQNKVWCM